MGSPGWCGSVDWAPACEPKDRWLDSLSGHMPGLQARAPVGGVQEATDWCFLTHRCFSPILSPSLTLSLKINKYLKNKNKSLFKKFFKWSNYLTDTSQKKMSEWPINTLKRFNTPGWCSSVGWASSHKLKGRRFDSWATGSVPSQGAYGKQPINAFLPLSLPSPLQI